MSLLSFFQFAQFIVPYLFRRGSRGEIPFSAPECELQIRCKATIATIVATTSRKVQQTATAIATNVATTENSVKRLKIGNCKREKLDVWIFTDGQLSGFSCGARKTRKHRFLVPKRSLQGEP